VNFATASIRYEKAIVFLVAVLACLGVWAYVRTPAAIFPEMKFSRVDVVAEVGNLPPEQVRVAVTMPLERAFLGLPAVQRVRSESDQGTGELIVSFDPLTDVQRDLQYVDQAVARVRSTLPPETNVDSTIITPQSEPVYSVAIASSDLSPTLLREYAQRAIVPPLYGIPGLGRILVVGGPQREFHVTLDPAALAAAKLTAQNVATAIGQANTVAAVGLAQRFSMRSALVVDAGVRNAGQIRAISVPTANGGSIPVGSLGSVDLGTEPPTNAVGFAGDHAIAINFYGIASADVVRMTDQIKKRLAAERKRLPRDVEMHTYWDSTVLIADSQKSLRDAILIGALLAVGVIYFFLRNGRMTAVSALIIPAAMSIAVLVLSLAGQTLNIMSVGGLAIGVGLIIDDAIVVVEGIAHTMYESPRLSVPDAVIATMSRLVAPMTASTLTTVVVFVPLTLLGGVSGAFFRALAYTLAGALIVSLALAIFVTPILVRAFMSKHPVREENAQVASVLSRYEHILRYALSHKRLIYAASVVVLIVTVVLIKLLPSDFLPALDEGQFEIKYRMPVGTTLAASDAAAQRMEKIVNNDPAVVAEGRFTGIDTNGFSPTPPRTGTIRVRLQPLGKRDSFEHVAGRLRDRLNAVVPAANLDVHQILEDIINDISGAPSPIEIELSGSDPLVLASAAQRLTDRISKVPGIADAFSGVVADDPTIRIRPNFSQLAQLGSDPSALQSALNAGSQGSIAANVPQASMIVPVRLRVASDPSGLPQQLALTSGTLSLAQVASTTVDRSSLDVTAIDGQRVDIITANVSGRSLSAIINDLQTAIAKALLPPGYRATIGGAYAAQQESFRQFVFVIAIAIVLVFFVMLLSFGSFRQPLVILTAVPLALIGVALGLFITRTPFNVSSFMGLLLLVGIVVKNGILLIDAANRARHEGYNITESLVHAGRQRLRPILMTTFAAIGGLLPLAFGIGAGAAMEKPLAIAVIGGLSTATFFTLVLIPVLYAAFANESGQPA
jgi:CzcA family heavy metal efflux pump